MALSILQEKALHYKLMTNMNQIEIAKELDIDPETLTNYNRDPEFQQAIRDRLQEKFGGDLAIKAAQKMEELLNCRNSKVQLQAAKYILDYGGYTPVARSEITNSAIEIFIKNNED